MSNKIFHVKKCRGVLFLVTPADQGNVAICDDQGNNYGVWFDFERFISFAKKEGSFEITRLDTVQVEQINRQNIRFISPPGGQAGE